VVWVTLARQQDDPAMTAGPLVMVGTFGLGLALAAGLSRLTDPDAAGLSPHDVSPSAALGVAALVFCQQIISPVPSLGRQDLDGPRVTVPLVMVGAAVLVALLFWLGRRRVARAGLSIEASRAG
jgi:hypothetical protein